MRGKMRIIFLLLATCLWAGWSGPVYAQEDSLSVFGLKMQRRFIPPDQPFHESGRNLFLQALENTSISLSGGYHRWLDREIGSGPVAGISIGRWITPRHGIRLEAGTGYLLDNENLSLVELTPDIRLSHLFNLSAFLDGYDASGAGYFYTVAGGGLAWRPSLDGTSWNVQLGLGYSLHILRGTDLFVEPSFELNGNGFLRQQDGNWRGYYSGVRGTVGLSYRLDRRNSLLPPKTEHRWFLEAAGGPAWLLASAFPSKMGYQLTIGAGERISPMTSIRLSGAWTQTFQPKVPERFSSYGALRLEALLNLAALNGREEGPWGFSLMAGPEAGIIGTSEEEPVILGGQPFPEGWVFYVGATAGAQLRARINRRFSAVLEPRASFIPYTATDGTRADNQLDILFSTNLGVHYDIPSVQERRAWWQKAQHKLNLTVSLEGSYFRPLGKEFANSPLVSLSLGSWLTDSFGLLFSGGVGYIRYLEDCLNHVKTSEYSAAFLLNLTRLAGKDRQVNLSLLAGGGYMQPWEEEWKGSPVFRTGVDVRMHVFPQTDLVMRPEINFLKAPTQKWTPALRGTFGLGYSVGGRESVAKFTDSGKEWYFALGSGIRFEASSTIIPQDNKPLGEYRMNLAIGRKYSPRLDWRLSFSYLSQLSEESRYDFLHQIRFASLNLDALYHLTGEDRKWSLSLVGGPEIGGMHRGNGRDGKVAGSELLIKKRSVSSYLGLSGGVQLKYRFVEGLSLYLEPRYSLAPYVTWYLNQTENQLAHLFGADFGLECALGRERSQEGLSEAKDYPSYTFFQLSETTFRPLGKGYGNGPIVSIGAGHWFKGASGALVEIGLGYFRDNQYSMNEEKEVHYPQHRPTANVRASWLLSLNRLVSLEREDLPINLSLMAGAGYLVPEFRESKKGILTVHGGLDFRIPVLRGTELVIQPQLELLRRDPHNLISGRRGGNGAAFRSAFGLSYNLSKQGPLPALDPGKNWFVTLSGGYQYETGRMADKDETGLSYNEYRIALSVGRQYSKAWSLRAGISFAEKVPIDQSFLHSLRYTSVNLDALYHLPAIGRLTFSLLAGPEFGLFNKEYRKNASYENPLSLPFKIGGLYHQGMAAYFSLSVGSQVKVGITPHISLYLEPRYSLVPYVASFSHTVYRNMFSHLWNTNLGIHYTF